jgi:hypothetical protein
MSESVKPLRSIENCLASQKLIVPFTHSIDEICSKVSRCFILQLWAILAPMRANCGVLFTVQVKGCHYIDWAFQVDSRSTEGAILLSRPWECQRIRRGVSVQDWRRRKLQIAAPWSCGYVYRIVPFFRASELMSLFCKLQSFILSSYKNVVSPHMYIHKLNFQCNSPCDSF